MLSYAPVVRVREGPDPEYSMPETLLVSPPDEYPPYKPVDWMIDNTPLRKPLFWWADLWGVGVEFELATLVREARRLDLAD